MKTSSKVVFLSGFVLAISASGMVAQPFTFNENGQGTDFLDIVAYPPLTRPMQSMEASDPSGGITGSPVLIYTLPYLVAAGDVVLTEAGQSGPSDLIRFFNAPGTGNSLIIFYSDIQGSASDPTGAGIPYSANPIAVGATGPQDTASWDPTPGQPGFFNGYLPTFSMFRYDIIGAAPTPEPGSMALLLAGATVLLWVRRTRRVWEIRASAR